MGPLLLGEIGLWGAESRGGGGETRREAGAGGQASVAGGGREVAGFGIDSELWCGLLVDGMWEQKGKGHRHVSE